MNFFRPPVTPRYRFTYYVEMGLIALSLGAFIATHQIGCLANAFLWYMCVNRLLELDGIVLACAWMYELMDDNGKKIFDDATNGKTIQPQSRNQ